MLNIMCKQLCSEINGYHENVIVDRLITRRLQREFARGIVSCQRMNSGLNRLTGVGSTCCLRLNLTKPSPLRYAQIINQCLFQS